MPSNARGTRNLLSRVRAIVSRFGITPKKIETRLNRYIDITEKFGCVPTFPVTAVTLRRHPELIRKIAKRGVELAIHGYIHIDYKSLSLEEQARHFAKAIDTFKSCHIPFKGFRAPYLRSNDETLEALSRLEIAYDSSHAMHWAVADKSKYPKKLWSEHGKLLDFYQPRDAAYYLVLPKFQNGLVEIPVSIPDDEAMVDRLRITDKKEITEIWGMILERTYTRGELFTLQLHHERISLCGSALEAILQRARELDPPVWIATLSEIAEWWQERHRFTFEVDSQGNGEYRVKANCSGRATLLLRNCEVNRPTAEWSGGYQSLDATDFLIESPTCPSVGVGPNASPHAISFLKSEGFIVEVSDQPDNYGIYFANLTDFQETDEKLISEAIESSSAPLLRYWRWPSKAKSALAITGDIDSITLIDFVMRVFEVWRQNGRYRL